MSDNPNGQNVNFPGDTLTDSGAPWAIGGMGQPQQPVAAEQQQPTEQPQQQQRPQSTLKKILLGVFDTIATSQGFPNHYDYQRREQQMQLAQQRMDIEKTNSDTMRQATLARLAELKNMMDKNAPAQWTPEQAAFIGHPVDVLNKLGMTKAQQEAQIGAHLTTADSNSRFQISRDSTTGEISVFDKVKANELAASGGNVGDAFKTYKARGGAAGVEDIRNTIAETFKGAGVNPNKMPPIQRAQLEIATRQAIATGTIKPVEDAINRISSAESSKTNMYIRMEGLAQMRQNSVLDTKYGNRPVMVSSEELNRAAVKEPGRYLTGSVGASALNKQALASDIHGAIARAKTSLMKLDKDFSPEFRSKMAFASRTPDPYAAMNALVNSQAAAELTPAQQDYLINHLQVIENMMAMRSVLGAGQGSDELRAAIRQTVTNAPSRQFAAKQYDTADATVSRLERGIPQVPLRPEGGAAPSLPPGVYARDPSGVLHRQTNPNAKLPAGWKLEQR